MISKVKGFFKDFEGSGVVDGEDTLSGELNVSVKTGSITTNEENRDEHLKSADFFDAETFPEATFRSTGVEPGKSPSEFVLHGNLTIKDVTKPVSFDVSVGGVATDPYGQTKAAAEAVATINRTDFGLTWNQALEAGGVLVSEKVTIVADVQAVLNR